MHEKFDVLVVGAGLLGSSTAMHLAAQGQREVTVVDLDLEGAFSSSELNAGGVRATWNHPVNAGLSKLSIDYFESVAEEIGFRQKGYFWMYSAANWSRASEALKKNANIKGLGVEYLSPGEVTERFPFIDKTADLGGATFSPKDGLLNSNLLKNHFRARAKAGGARFLNRIWVSGVEFLKNGEIEISGFRFEESFSQDSIEQVLTKEKTVGGHPWRGTCKALVNCSGPWAKRMAGLLGVIAHCHPVRRQISVFECKDVDLNAFGMFVDASGVYFHPEANNIIGGYAVESEPEGCNFDYDGEAFFESYIWPALYERSTKFESLKHLTGWGGLYEVSDDRNAIVGAVPGIANVFEAHSFSGRGAMQSYAAGLGLAELIGKGKYESIDLTELSGERFLTGKILREGMLI